MVKSLYEKAEPVEINHIFRHFDKGGKGYLSKQDFLTVISNEIRETSYQNNDSVISIEDIIKPLATRIRK